MKKTLILCLMSFCFLAGKAQFGITNGDTVAYTGVTSPSFETLAIGFCKNTGTTPLTLSWQIVADSAVSGWTYTGFCDKTICYNYAIGESKSFVLQPDSQGIMEVHLTAGCHPGFGYVQYILWSSADSANTVQKAAFTFTLAQSTACAAGITNVETSQIAIYPNPVRNELNVSLPYGIDNGQIDIYNILGSKVYSQPMDRGRDIDVSNLETGLYVARISEGGKVIATRKFTKAQ